LGPENVKRDNLFKSKCDDIMRQFNLSVNGGTGNEEVCPEKSMNKQVSQHHYNNLLMYVILICSTYWIYP